MQSFRSSIQNVLEISQKPLNSSSLKSTMSNKRKVLPVDKVVQFSVKNRLKFKQNEKKYDAKPTNFAHVFRPIYYFARLCGQMPFSIVHGTHGGIREIRIRTIDALWFFISICIYSTLTCCVCVYLVRAFSNYRIDPSLYVLASGVNLLRLINFLCGILILIMDMCNRHKLVNILKKFTTFDREASYKSHKIKNKNYNVTFDFKLIWLEMQNLSPRWIQVASKRIYFNYQKDTQYAWLYCIATILTLLLLNVTTYSVMKFYRPNPLYTIGIALFSSINTTKTLFTTIPVIAFTFLLRSLHQRFVVLNSFLK